MNKPVYLSGVLLILLATQGVSHAAVIRVGPTGDLGSISAAAERARNGDVIEIESGEWHADVALWQDKDLTIRGVGSRPVLYADGNSIEGKAIWVFRKGKFIVDNIEFRGARVADGNGAGIRLESGKLLVKNCHFFDNENGILTSNNQDVELVIENSLFAEAPHKKDPPQHLLYVGRIASLKISGSRFHNGFSGHLIKSRARETDISYNLIFDGPEGTSSYEVDLPSGGNARLIGNVIEQSHQTQNPIMVAYGAEGSVWPRNNLLIAHNTMISDGVRPAWFVRVWKDRVSRDFKVTIVNNLYSGFGLFNYGLTGEFEGNWLVPESAFQSPSTLDFRLAKDTIFRRLVSASQNFNPLTIPQAEFKLPLGTQPVGNSAGAMPGAFQ